MGEDRKPNVTRAKVNPKKRMTVWKRDKFRCVYCACAVTPPHPTIPEDLWATVDHATPRCRGGTNDVSNLKTACRTCNMTKSGMTVEEYRAAGMPKRNPKTSPGAALKRGWR